VEEKRFRADLMARLDGLRIKLLPLRSRVEEVPNLFTRLLKMKSGQAPGMDASVVESLCCHGWPLNIREVTNLAKRVMALHGNEKMLKRSQLAALMGDTKPAAKTEPATAAGPAPNDEPTGLVLSEGEERQRILDALERSAGNQTVAARLLKISRSTLVIRLKRYGIRRPQADRDA
jgi:two-component system NtrC family response regulator